MIVERFKLSSLCESIIKNILILQIEFITCMHRLLTQELRLDLEINKEHFQS